MDLTPEYINMCRRAEEIQAMRPIKKRGDYEPGDWYKPHILHQADFTAGDPLVRVAEGKNDSVVTWDVWLPRQDQLQEMLGSYRDCFNLIDRWEQDSALGYDYPDCKSFEQLWLSIVMKQLYGKTWDGGKWTQT